MQSIYILILQNIEYVYTIEYMELWCKVQVYGPFLFLRENLHWAQCILIAQE